jgi:predicted thioredoxin/glutaredoxin
MQRSMGDDVQGKVGMSIKVKRKISIGIILKIYWLKMQNIKKVGIITKTSGI